MSLVGSIFGEQQEKKPVGAAASLFDQSPSTLPEKPHHVVARRKQKKRKVETLREEKVQKKARKDTATADKKKDDAAAASPNQEQQQQDNNVEERTIFVGNLPLTTTRKSLASLFKSCGKVESCRLRSVAASGVKLPPEQAGDQNLVKKVCSNTNRLDKDAKSTAQGYVVFVSKDSVAEALKLNNTLHDESGLRLRVDHATPTMDASRSVFVGNLPYHAEESTLHQHFVTGCGFAPEHVEGVRIVRDKDTMQCKGFGYVLFQEKSMVAVALQKMHGSKYMRRELRVTVCGKRFKGNKRGDAASQKKRSSFEGKRSDAGAMKRILSKAPSSDTKTKKRRARGETKKKPGAKKEGVSKRAAAEAKLGKRMKKIQKRVSKGMGKSRVK